MPRRRTNLLDLTPPQEREFLDVVENLFEGSAFDSERQKLEAWRVHGERLTEKFVAENPGKRPPGWWQFEAPRDRPVFPEDRPEGADPTLANEAAWLDTWGELSEEEREQAPDPSPAEWEQMPEEERAKAERLPFWMD